MVGNSDGSTNILLETAFVTKYRSPLKHKMMEIEQKYRKLENADKVYRNRLLLSNTGFSN